MGSFLGVVVDRVVKGEQFLKGRSRCEKCKYELSAKDLIPIFSFLYLRGKCRYCKKSIPMSLPLIEITAVIVFPFAIMQGFYIFLLSIILFVIFFSDLKYKLIPDIYFYLLGLLYILGLVLSRFLSGLSPFFTPLPSHLLAALAMGLFFLFLVKVTKGKGMGEGDIFLSALLGLYLGASLSVVMWFTAFTSGALIGLILMALQRKKMKSQIPFGPFLIFGFVVALIFGQSIIQLYLDIFII